MSTSPLSPEDIRAAAETHRDLGPEYSDAVVASFIEKVEREVAARVEARLAGAARAAPPVRPARRPQPPAKPRILRDVLAASVGALAVVLAITLLAVAHGAPGPLSRIGSRPSAEHICLMPKLNLPDAGNFPCR